MKKTAHHIQISQRFRHWMPGRQSEGKVVIASAFDPLHHGTAIQTGPLKV